MTFKQPRSTFASFKARWIRTSLSLHLATFDSSSYRLLFQTMLLITEAIAQQSPVHPLSCLNFTLMCWTAQFYSNAPSHATDVHSIAMQV